ncbi:hypothetical protein [Thiohalorhabdus methylotrophus]|uniref:Polymer-forming cytoskeletal protein n=1 Tax=Thiohalorhabdus methylotrophus TaxID=3242694 RepID=A0ABV4TRK9_9GAMM
MVSRGIPALLGLLLLVGMGPLAAQWAGETVTIQEPADRDLYLAGRVLEVLAPVRGDVAAAGQHITVHGPIAADLIAAGETLRITTEVGDDVRAAARRIHLDAPVGGHVVAAAEEITLEPAGRVEDWLWTAAGRVRLDGEVRGTFRAYAEEVAINGRVGGDAYVRAEEVRIGPRARISGDLIWTGPGQPRVAPESGIGGRVIQRPAEDPGTVPPKRGDGGWGATLFFLVSLAVTGIVGFLLFPGAAVAAADAALRRPWASLALGLAGLATTPVVAAMLLATGVGYLLALTLLALYMVGLLLGALAGLFLAGEGGLRLFGARSTRLRRSLALAGAVVLVAVLQWIPYLGPATAILLLLLGLGGLQWLAFRAYRDGMQGGAGAPA